MKTRSIIIIGIIVFVAIYTPIQYSIFLDNMYKNGLSVFCEAGFVLQNNKCVTDFKTTKEISVDDKDLKLESTEFKHGEIKLDKMILNVQIADDDNSRSKGLMFQEQLPFDEGMLFIFAKPDLYAMWMLNMKFYLDIIWFDNEGNVVHIEKNIRPCQTALEIQTCPDIISDYDSLYVLEVTSGFVDKFNVTNNSKFSWNLR